MTDTRVPPSSWVEWAAETMADMMANGARLPLVVEHGANGAIIVTELTRHHPARWNAAEWAAADKSRLLSGMMISWERMHTALAGDPESDPDATMVLLDAEDEFLTAANDFCAEVSKK